MDCGKTPSLIKFPSRAEIASAGLRRAVSALKLVSTFAMPFVKYRLGRDLTPMLAGYKITHRCNLKCRHCPYWRRTGPEQGFDGVVTTLRLLNRMGVRILILEGGEPLLWRDGSKSIGHVVDEARKLFTSVCMTTNGTLPWGRLPLDRTWVSLDGPQPVHDSIRGPGIFDKVWANLESEGKGRAFISTTVNTQNLDSIREMLFLLRGRVDGVTIQFHYPYHGLPDPLFVPSGQREPLLDELISLKAQGLPVANSTLSLTELKRERWTCEDKLLANAEPDGTILHGCYLKNRGPSQCSLCGFSAHNEMSLAFRGAAESILTGMRAFFL